MRIVIVGGGAIGRLFGTFLVKGGNEIVLIDKDKLLINTFQEKGIGLLGKNAGIGDDAEVLPVKAFHSAKNITEADLVILLVKSQATLAAIKDISHLINHICPLLLIQTGLGNYEKAKKVVSEEHIILGISSLTGTALSDGRVKFGGMAETQIGETNGRISKRIEKISAIFNQSNISTQMVERIIGRLWSKVIVYAAINPVSALLQVPNGMLTSSMDSITLMKRLLDEGREVADASAVELVYPDLYKELFDTCDRSGANLSPMLQDILNGNPTEIEAQNGALCKFAKRLGVAVPTHTTMVELVKLKESWKTGID